MRTRWLVVLATLAAALLVGPTTATAQVPDDGPDASASASLRLPAPFNEPTVEFVNTGMGPMSQTDGWCMAVTESTSRDEDLGMWEGCAGSGESWRQWDINFTNQWSTGGTPLYEIKNPHTGFCLSLEQTETGAANDGYDAQQEPCERRDDALWWFSSDGHGHVLVRPYLKNSAGRYPCLEADHNDLAGWIQVQIYDCGNTAWREWNVILRDNGVYVWP
jgi:hypothetical protein